MSHASLSFEIFLPNTHVKEKLLGTLEQLEIWPRTLSA